MTETEQEYKEILNKGVEYVAKREFDRAIECFNQIPQDSTLFFQVQCLKGAAMEELRLYEAAIECFDNIPQYHDLFDYVQYLKGLILIKLNRDKEAIECFNLIKISPFKYCT